MKESFMNSVTLTETVARLADSADTGAIAFLRTSEVAIIDRICKDLSRIKDNRIADWEIYVVDDDPNRKIPFVIQGDKAVELREAKEKALILIINDRHQESGLDGIFSAGREISEVDLINEYRNELLETSSLWGSAKLIELAIKYSKEVATLVGRLEVIELIEFANDLPHFLENLWRIGLWPIAGDTPANLVNRYLEISKGLVRDLLRVSSNSAMPTDRLRSLDIIPNGNEEDLLQVSRFISECDKSRIQDVFVTNPLDDKFFVGNWDLQLLEQDEVREIFLEAWRGSNGKATAWSGLSTDDNGELEYVINVENTNTSKDLTVRWTTEPKSIRKGGVLFNVELFIGDESKENREVLSSGKNRNEVKIRADVFEIEAGDNLDARVVVSFRDSVRAETESFIVKDGASTKKSGTSSSRTYRTIGEFLLEAENPEMFAEVAKGQTAIATTTEREINLFYLDGKKPIKGKIKLPWGWRRCWQLIEEHNYELGKFTMQLSKSGKLLVSSLEFVPFSSDEIKGFDSSIWNSVVRRLRSSNNVYACHLADNPEQINKFANLWKEAIEKDAYELSLANTISVLDGSGQTKAVIFLPESPIRLLFRSYYDQFTEFLSSEGKAAEVKSVYESVSGNGFPTVFPLHHQDSIYGVMRSCDALDINTQLLVTPEITDNSSLPTQIRGFWYLDDQDNFDITAEDLWQAEQISKEIAATRSSQMAGSDGLSSTDLTILASFGGGDGATLLTALTMSREQNEASKSKQAELDESSPAFSLSMYPTISYDESYYQSTELDYLGGKFEDLWEIARKSKNEVPQKYRWIFERPSRNARNSGFGLVWRKSDLREKLAESDGAIEELYHLAIFFSVGTNAAIKIDAKEININRPKSLLYGLVRTWDTQRSLANGKVVTVTVYDDLANAEKFDSRRTKNILADITSAIERKVRDGIGGSGETIAFIKTISEQEQNFIIDAHRYSEKVVILDSGAMEVYRSRGVANGEYLIGETIANGASVVQSSISAVRTSSLLAIGYKPSKTSCLLASDTERAMQFIIAALQEIPGISQIYYTDRNDRSELALCFALGYFAATTDKSSVGAAANEAIVQIPLIDLPNSMRIGLHQNLVETSFAVLRIKNNMVFLSIALSAIEETIEVGVPEIVNFMTECHRLWGEVLSLTSSRKRWSDRIALAKVIEQHVRGLQSTQLRPQQQKTILEKISNLRQLQCDTLPIEYDDTSMDTVIAVDFNFDVDPAADLRSVEIKSLELVEAFENRIVDRESQSFPSFTSSEALDDPVINAFNNRKTESNAPLINYEIDLVAIAKEENSASTTIENNKVSESCLEGSEATPNSAVINIVEAQIEPELDTQLNSNAKANTSITDAQVTDTSRMVISSSDDPNPADRNQYRASDETVATEISIEVGVSRSKTTVTWQPSVSTNPHMIVTGLSGVGKTTFIMGVVKQLKEQGIAPIVISFHQDVDEIMEEFFADSMNVSDINNASFNPLYFTESELQRNRYIVNDIANGVSGMLSLLFPPHPLDLLFFFFHRKKEEG